MVNTVYLVEVTQHICESFVCEEVDTAYWGHGGSVYRHCIHFGQVIYIYIYIYIYICAKFLPKDRKQLKSEITRLYCDIMDSLFNQIPDFFVYSKTGIKGAFKKNTSRVIYPVCLKALRRKLDVS